MQEVRYRKGEVIFSEGEPGTQCYRIVEGRVGISLGLAGALKRGQSEPIAECGPGEIIGAMSVISKGRRSASATAIEPTRCLSYSEDEIIDILENDPLEALTYIRTLIRHQRESNRTMAWGNGRRR
ncbi:MAG TPA: cyclic nucleotide-binding domain-containing protein [Thermohalobaculum sp.]|jgi:CRP-like cAMP-binding protein|nr:cyclic nucleotide-binding domain-containing protein [Thermohalobaculum sp.]